MKKSLIFIFSLLMMNVLCAQKVTYDDGSFVHKGMEIDAAQILLSPKEDLVRDKLENWFNENYNVNLDDKKLLFFDKEIMTAEKIQLDEISPMNINLWVKVDETNTNESKVLLAASFGAENWIDAENYKKEFDGLKTILKDFVRDYLPEYYQDRVVDNRETVQKINQEIIELQEEIDENKKKIRELELENTEKSEKIVEAESKLDEAEQKLDESRNNLKRITNRVIGEEDSDRK